MSRIKKEILRDIPRLSYDIVEANFKHLQGQVLTIVEAVVPQGRQLQATKDLIKDKVNTKLTMLFDLYGDSSKSETPAYSITKADANAERD